MTIGYDKLPINHEILLDLTLEEMTGLLAHDRAKPHHIHTLHGTPAWASLANGLPYLDFNPAHPDFLDCPAADTADLNFIGGAFSGAVWIAPDSLAGGKALLARGALGTGGWMFYQLGASLAFFTIQAGDFQMTESLTVLYVGTWALCGFTRLNTGVKLFHNGTDVTSVPATHTNPDTVNMELHIGIRNDEVTSPFEGKMAGGPCGPRLWGRKLEAVEMRQIFEQERHWFGV